MDAKMSVMIVDDEMIVRESFLQWFRKMGHVTDTAKSGPEALKKLDQYPFDLLFVDIKMPGMDGIELLEKVKRKYPDVIVVIITAYGSIESSVKAMKLGASDYLLKPFKPNELNLVLEKAIQQKKLARESGYLKRSLEKITRFDNMIGQSAAMEKVFNIIVKISPSDASVLILGETGTGKELVAKAVHAQSERRQQPFIAVNCGAVPDSILGSELFGHQKGAFTGAVNTRKGFFEIVSGGTLFLDEIGEISPKMQVDLLRVLEEKKITRIGGSQTIDVDFRLIAATCRNLEEAIQTERFREDLYYRVNVITIQLPPLRERKEDIPLLVAHFINQFSHDTTKPINEVKPAAMHLLQNHEWPGNIRELKNAIERAIVLSKAPVLDAADFSFLKATPPSDPPKLTLYENEKRYIQQTLDDFDWNVTQAAKFLDIHRVTLHKKIKRFGLKRTEA